MWRHTPAPTQDKVEPLRTAPPAATAATIPQKPVETPRSATLGKSVVIKGDLIGSEDLTIDGHVEGRIELRGHNLLIGPNASINARITAGSVTIMGSVTGHVTATEKVDLRQSGSLEGDIDAPVVAMAAGANFHGRIDTRSAREEKRQPLALAG